jgi:ankyrin repeat protein
VKYLVEEKSSDVSATGKDGDTPLHLTTEKGNLDVVKYLVEQKGADIKAADEYGSNPLHWAAYSGKLDAVKYLEENAKTTDNDKNLLNQISSLKN